MAGRVTDSHMTSTFLSNIGHTKARMAELQAQMSSGKAFMTADQNPTGAGQMLGFDAQLQEISRFKANVADSLSLLGVQDTALGDVTGSLRRVRDLVLQAANGTTDQQGRNAIASEIRQLKESIRGTLNSQYGSMYVFSGTSTSTQPYPAASNTYAGTTATMERRVAPGLQVAVNLDGPSVAGTTSGSDLTDQNIFDMLDLIAGNLISGTPSEVSEVAGDGLRAIDAHIDNVIEQRTNLGAIAGRLESTQNQLMDMEERLSASRSEIADVDMAATYMQYQAHSSMYESALAAGARIMRTSLLDFL
jgi:flagellar hook-associated protein 3 FlgL